MDVVHGTNFTKGVVKGKLQTIGNHRMSSRGNWAELLMKDRGDYPLFANLNKRYLTWKSNTRCFELPSCSSWLFFNRILRRYASLGSNSMSFFPTISARLYYMLNTRILMGRRRLIRGWFHAIRDDAVSLQNVKSKVDLSKIRCS